MTAFTHNVCALFCKLMVVDVCLLLMYNHYESWFRHSTSLSELLLCFWTNSPWPKKKKKIGNKMLLSSKKIVKSDLWVKKKWIKWSWIYLSGLFLYTSLYVLSVWVKEGHFNLQISALLIFRHLHAWHLVSYSQFKCITSCIWVILEEMDNT